MKISIPVNHNFYEEAPISNLGKAFGVKQSSVKNLQEIFSSVYELKLGAEQLKQIKVFHFKSKRIFEQDEERLILKLYSKEKEKEKNTLFKLVYMLECFFTKVVKLILQQNMATLF